MTVENPLINVQKLLKEVCDYLNVNENLYEYLKEPQRIIEVSIPVKMDDGTLKIFKGYRSQHCDIMGPFKGGIRFHPNVNADEVKALSIWMSLKCSATNLPFGGGKGGITVDVNQLSNSELERLSRGYIKEIYKYIGDKFDIPAPDVNTNEQIMSWMLDEYINLSGKNSLATFTGKPVVFGGSYGRSISTGVGVALVTRESLKKLNIDIKKSTVAIQGFGNVGMNSAKKLYKMGSNIISISEYDKEHGVYTIYKEEGFDVNDLIEHFREHKTLYNYENCKKISIDQFYSLEVDVIIPCALENTICKEEANKIRAKLIVEGANGPINYEADRILEEKNILVIPDIIANSGGVIASYFEWTQDISGIIMTEDDVLNKLEYKILNALTEITLLQEEYKVTLRKSAYIYAISRIYQLLKLRSRL